MGRISFLLLAFAYIATGCNSASQSKNEASEISTNTTISEEQAGLQGSQTSTNGQQTGNGFWERLVMQPFYDKQGALMAEMPMPSSWELIKNHGKGEPGITGPGGVRITDYEAESYMYTNDPRMQQLYYQTGQKLRAWPGVEQLIQQDVVPWCAQDGFELVKYYEVPEITKVDKWYNDQLYKAVPTRSEVMAVGTEWKSADGTPYFLLLHIFISTSAELQMWYYFSSGLEADKEHFEKAKKQLLFALSNTRYALEPIMAYNQREARKAGQSWAAFNQRMAQNQAAFEAQQRNFINKSNAVNDAIMSGWRASNAASDRMQEQRIDAIYERTNAIDPSTGQKYKVDAGYNQYWMNSNGEYISSNLSGYNPNLDDNMNQQRWQELKEVK